MTRVITAYTPDEALSAGLFWLSSNGIKSGSRAGPVLVSPVPVVTCYLTPQWRVIFNPKRDANPVFHLMEAMWMLAGRQNVGPLLPFNGSFNEFAEENGNQWGAYGYRWRHWFGYDQLKQAIHTLASNPKSRQVVLQMWDGCLDMTSVDKRDRPCNTNIYFSFHRDVLDMTVCCRSNDIVLGAYGANVVHMSILHEFVSAATGLPLGAYYQFSNNYHAYTEHDKTSALLYRPYEDNDYYQLRGAEPLPLVNTAAGETWMDFLHDCEAMFPDLGGDHDYMGTLLDEPMRTEFASCARGLARAFIKRKLKDADWRSALQRVPENWDFAVAFREWAERREDGSK